MNPQEYEALKATMPWTERVFQTPKGGIVQVVNAQGFEVPLFDMTRFLIMITHKIAQGKETVNEPTSATA